LNNQAGLVTIDFLFAIVLGFGMTAILFAMTFTLTVVEVAQYITFSAARAHAAANINKDTQKTAAREKYSQLISSAALAPLFSGGWFELSKKNELEIRSGETESFKDEYKAASSPNRAVFTGVRTTFTAHVLDMQLPMIGKTSDDDGGFKTKILTVMIREPSQEECQQFMKSRIEAINKLEGGTRFSSYSSASKAVPMEDNGC
jgi:hypothetical protein